MRIVLDINVLLISLPVHSPYRPIFDAIKQGKFTLLITNEILMEYEEKLAEKTRPEISASCCRAVRHFPIPTPPLPLAPMPFSPYLRTTMYYRRKILLSILEDLF